MPQAVDSAQPPAACPDPTMSSHVSPYPIGTPGQPWREAEVSEWSRHQPIQRSYADDVLTVVEQLAKRFDHIEYGRLAIDPARYPLHALRSPDWDDTLPTLLVTGGVHGYETSGVLGALRFLDEVAEAYDGRANLLVAPCVSPWGYERIQRWNHAAVDPNRSFCDNSPSQEAAALWALVQPLRARIVMHIDLHETTDTDETEFRPALAARDGKPFEPGEIPDGFYLVDDTERPQPAFQNAVIQSVAAVTHIAEADAQGEIIGSPMVAPGVIRYPLGALQLCAGMTDARYRTTTEVYPDSPRTDAETCIRAQVAAVTAAIDFALAASA